MREHGLAGDDIAEADLVTRRGTFRTVAFRDPLDGNEHLALVLGEVGDQENVLARVHSECVTGDIFAAMRCECGDQLAAALDAIVEEKRGVLVYLRGHEGRGIGLLAKLRAYSLQDAGVDTVDANVELGLPVDAREFSNAAQILADLGVKSVRLLTNNPAKLAGMDGHGIKILGREPMPAAVNPHNARYLRAKRDRLGHEITGDITVTVGIPVNGNGSGNVSGNGSGNDERVREVS